MILDDIIILLPAVTKDAIGRAVPTYNANRTIKGHIEPISYMIQDRPFGITDKTTHMLFCTDFNIKADNRIGWNNEVFTIEQIKLYKIRAVLMLSKVI